MFFIDVSIQYHWFINVSEESRYINDQIVCIDL